jgi:predicted Zn-ribbon and HTH transcriptional regulator
MANKLSQEQFEEEVYKHNSNIKIISRYKNMHSSVTYKCKICGFEETINDATFTLDNDEESWFDVSIKSMV